MPSEKNIFTTEEITNAQNPMFNEPRPKIFFEHSPRDTFPAGFFPSLIYSIYVYTLGSGAYRVILYTGTKAGEKKRARGHRGNGGRNRTALIKNIPARAPGGERARYPTRHRA